MTPDQINRLEKLMGSPLQDWQRVLIERPHDDRLLEVRKHQLTVAEFWLCRVADRLMAALDGTDKAELETVHAEVKSGWVA